ncbi:MULTISPECIES: hypothetical protein [Clostridia]|uniref:Uncharacterized protein n=1 Tax=Aminicella lysinilytica TaxID=433323 RepID=A0A4R6Q317_9FIRM|nr:MULTISPECIES: hypothetical protein [Clostridia]MDT4376949.1 hypothetical protein [Blautia coccoides]TDP56417.1 hypothetical protein EV211_11539 [Aminicella lysinilytica]
MENEEKIIFNILSGLPDKWKSFFGLYTQYIGYLTADMAKTLLVIKRCSYFDIDFDYSNIDLDKINIKALEYELSELPYRDKEGLDAVIPVLWEYLDEFDLCEISDESWNGLVKFLDNKIAKEK